MIVKFFKKDCINTRINNTDIAILTLDNVSVIKNINHFVNEIVVDCVTNDNLQKIFKSTHLKIESCENDYHNGFYTINNYEFINDLIIKLTIEVNYINEFNNFIDVRFTFLNRKNNDLNITKNYQLDNLELSQIEKQFDHKISGFYVLIKSDGNYLFNKSFKGRNLNQLIKDNQFNDLTSVSGDNFNPLIGEASYYLFYINKKILDYIKINELFNASDILKVYPSFYDFDLSLNHTNNKCFYIENNGNFSLPYYNETINKFINNDKISIHPIDVTFKETITQKNYFFNDLYSLQNINLSNFKFVIGIKQPLKLDYFNFSINQNISIGEIEDNFIRNVGNIKTTYNEYVSINNVTFEFLQTKKVDYNISQYHTITWVEDLKKISKSCDNIIDLDNTDKQALALKHINSALNLIPQTMQLVSSANPTQVVNNVSGLTKSAINNLYALTTDYKKSTQINATSDYINYLNGTLKISFKIFNVDNIHQKQNGFKNINFQTQFDDEFSYKLVDFTYHKYNGKYNLKLLLEKLKQIKIINGR